MSICDCEKSHNGMGLAGRECDCLVERMRAMQPQIVGDWAWKLVLDEAACHIEKLEAALAAAREQCAKVCEDLGERVFHPTQVITDRCAAAIRALSPSRSPNAKCDHQWVDARNSAVLSGEICLKCNAVRAGNSLSPNAKGETYE